MECICGGGSTELNICFRVHLPREISLALEFKTCIEEKAMRVDLAVRRNGACLRLFRRY